MPLEKNKETRKKLKKISLCNQDKALPLIMDIKSLFEVKEQEIIKKINAILNELEN
jgi:hypothetical protein